MVTLKLTVEREHRASIATRNGERQIRRPIDRSRIAIGKVFKLTGIAYARSVARSQSGRGDDMRNLRNLRSALLVAVAIIAVSAARASALTIDVCVNPATDARFDGTGFFFTASAPIYPAGTIKQSSSAIDCTAINALSIGTFFTNGGLVAGLPASDPKDVAMVTWHFRLGNKAFDTAGPVQGVAPGQTYPQTVIGSTFVPILLNSRATVKALDPSGFVFEIKTTGF
jgi:hypothetical protein